MVTVIDRVRASIRDRDWVSGRLGINVRDWVRVWVIIRVRV